MKICTINIPDQYIEADKNEALEYIHYDGMMSVLKEREKSMTKLIAEKCHPMLFESVRKESVCLKGKDDE
jgi:hypothetical protein